MEEQAQKRKKIIVGIPGSSFSSKFLLNWTQTMFTLWQAGKYEVVICPGESSFVTFARMKTLGADVMRGKNQKPFNSIDYDVFVTIDSDILFSAEQFIKLVENAEKYKVVAGYYMMSDMKNFAVVRDWDEEYFAENGTFKFSDIDDINDWRSKNQDNMMPVSYVGMGFMACTKEALETLEYPFFQSKLQKIKGKDGLKLVDMCSEDVSFCKNLQSKGFNIYVDTDLRVGHEKKVIL